jgi:hypothetical protein
MLRRISLVPALVAAFALAACQPKVPENPGNAVNAAADNYSVATNVATGSNVGASANGAVATNVATGSNVGASSNTGAAPAGGYAANGPGEVCGGIVGKQCTIPGQYCKLPQGQCKTVSDAQGTCTARPQVCGKIFKPVCGCNGKTYGNECEASKAGVSVQSAGQCPKK